MKLLFWLSLGGVLYTYLGYPVIIWALARLRPRRWFASAIQPSVSIVLPVHNGGSLISHKIDHLCGLDYRHIQEVIVVSDGSTDGTAEFLASAQHPRVHPVIVQEQVGKAAALNAGVARASADIILFVDIRPWIDTGAVQQLVSSFADPSVGCVTGELNLREDGHDAATAAIGDLYWRHEQWIRKCESTFDSPVGVYGGFYAVRRNLIVNQPDGLILDDMFQPLSIIRQGYRSVLDTRARVFDTWPKETKREFARKVRTLAGNYQLFAVASWSLTARNRVLFQLISHKVMRLIVPFLFLGTLASSAALAVHSPTYAALAIPQILLWVAALLSLNVRVPILQRLLAPAGALLVLNAAAVMGLFKFLTTRSPLWKLWDTGQMGIPQNQASTLRESAP